jgi:hypothetical protein
MNDHDWFDMKLVMNFSVAGGSGTLYRRNVTLGEKAYTQIAGLTNIPLGFTAVGGVYTLDRMSFRCDSLADTYGGGIGYVDNYSCVPEPSVLAMLGAGLCALLAYAWRKRK